MVDKNVVGEFLQAIQPKDSNTDHTYNATVTQVDDQGVVWVQLAGSDNETPTASTSSEVKRGDEVNVQWRNNQLYIAGNYSNPSAGSIRVNAVELAAQIANQAATNAVEDAGVARAAAEDAKATANSVRGIAEQAQEDAGRAKDAADNASEYAARAFGNLSTVQNITETLTWITQHGTMALTTDVALDPTHVYFVQDAGGDYVVGGVTYAIVTEPDVADIGTYYELSIDESLNNYVGTHLALTSEGLWLIPEVGGNKVLIATGGVGHTYEDAGTYIIDENDNISAQFLEDGTTIYGPSNTLIAHLGYGQGYNQSGQLVDAPFYTLGTRTGAIGNYSVAEGLETTASGFVSHAEGGNGSTASGNYSHAEGNNSTASEQSSHAEGDGTTASGKYSHAEGQDSVASGKCSHAEGGDQTLFGHTTASGDYSHAEGLNTTASGESSHAEGQSTTASGQCSHAEGMGNASGYVSHAEGFGNAIGSGSHAESDSEASGQYSHSQNKGTVAQRKSQTAIGEYNIADTTGADGTVRGDYALIIGNGTLSTPSNALTVDWSGNVCLALDTAAASGTDHDLYAAITALGWQSDVIV